jgi:hypothetical protein
MIAAPRDPQKPQTPHASMSALAVSPANAMLFDILKEE